MSQDLIREYEEKLKQLEQENKNLQDQLQAAGAKVALGELLGTVTHEFNNMLMTVINYTSLGLRDTDTQRRTNALQKIDLASRRAAKISESILAMAKNRKPHPEPTDLIQLTEDILLLLEREMRKYRVSVDTSFAPNLPEINAQGNQIQQVLLNLLINARQAMPDGGNVTIKIEYNANTNTVDCSIQDNGTGIPTNILPHIFEPSFTTKKGPDASGKGGNGVGLAMCKKIIDEHHGFIHVFSTVGKGTRFVLKFPALPSEK
ncbi:MAG: ATP-binding protein [Planctomycetia bacterium]|nr:ATP-binding protein [Planctomycetia bacterium]